MVPNDHSTGESIPKRLFHPDEITDFESQTSFRRGEVMRMDCRVEMRNGSDVNVVNVQRIVPGTGIGEASLQKPVSDSTNLKLGDYLNEFIKKKFIVH
jgi:hypothetical protein